MLVIASITYTHTQIHTHICTHIYVYVYYICALHTHIHIFTLHIAHIGFVSWENPEKDAP
jgi:hypothetical protein